MAPREIKVIHLDSLKKEEENITLWLSSTACLCPCGDLSFLKHDLVNISLDIQLDCFLRHSSEISVWLDWGGSLNIWSQAISDVKIIISLLLMQLHDKGFKQLVKKLDPRYDIPKKHIGSAFYYSLVIV